MLEKTFRPRKIGQKNRQHSQIHGVQNAVGTVISRAFFYFLLHNHIINKKKSFSGEVKDSVIFPFFLHFIRELNHILRPYHGRPVR
jgi:hypothetical protein